MSGRIAGRAREWIWAQPGRSRGVALTAAVVVAVAGGAVAVFGPDDPSSGRVRHERGAPAAGPAGAGTADDAASGGTSPGSPATEPSTPGDTSQTGSGRPGAAGSSAAPGPTGTAATPGGTPGSTNGGRDPSTTSGPGGQGTAPTTRKAPTAPAAGGAATTPDTTVTDGPGWRQLPAAPIAGRSAHTAVWTGREMVVWGGIGGDHASDPFTDGAAFDPATRKWRKVPAAPLSPRFDHWAFWTGSEMVVYGGGSVESNDPLADGAAWNPQSNTWRPIAAPPTGARESAVVAWAGDRLVVWGGAAVPASEDVESEMRNDGAAWVAATGTWVAVPAAPIPARSGAESVWTGSRLVVTGGYSFGDDEDRTDGAAFDPVSGAWSPIAARPAPGSCGSDVPCAGVWTGSTALFTGTGLAYDPVADRWSALTGLPAGDGLMKTDDAMAWTGGRLLVWGIPAETTPVTGEESEVVEDDSEAVDEEEVETPEVTDDGGDGAMDPPAGFTYDPSANRWQDFAAGPLGGRDYHSAVWTGQEMLVWGGTTGDDGLADGAAYRPAG